MNDHHTNLDYDPKVRRAERAEAERDESRLRMEAIEHAGHRPDCGGMNEPEGRCGCGWLQREGAAQHIVILEDRLARIRAERDKMQRDNAHLVDEELKLQERLRMALNYVRWDQGRDDATEPTPGEVTALLASTAEGA